MTVGRQAQNESSFQAYRRTICFGDLDGSSSLKPTTAAGHELVLPDEVPDTVGIRNDKPGGQKSKRKSSKKHQQRKPSTPKPEREPRRLDPVPQFHLSELP